MASITQALNLGLVSKVVAEEQLESELDRLLSNINKAPLPALKAVKEYARAALSMDAQAASNYAKNLYATINSSSKMIGKKTD